MDLPLAITERTVTSLKVCAQNARKHSPKQIDQIARSIATFGFINPVLIDEEGEIIAGHGRFLAAQLRGLETIPVIILPHLNEAQKRAFRLADNKIAENSSWDLELVASELKHLSLAEADLDFHITSEIGFSESELDFYLGRDANGGDGDALKESDIPDHPKSLLGDCYELGNHRLLCGDARQIDNYNRLLDGHLADLILTDVPYNVPIQGHVSGRGHHKHAEFLMAAGEMPATEYQELLRSSLKAMVRVSRSGAVHFIFIDWRHIQELQRAIAGLYSEFLNLCVWNKSNAGMGSLYRSKHELVLVQKVGSAAHTNNIQLGRNGRHRTNVWDYPGCSSFGAGRNQALAMHPTVKPVQLLADAIQDCSKRGDRILDGFCGSGSTLMAAERTNRRGYGIELDPLYVDVTLNRWMRVTGDIPVLLPQRIKWPDLVTLRQKKSPLKSAEVGHEG